MPRTITDIKQALDSHVGDSLTVVAQVGRKRVTRRKGILAETFPGVFVINLNQEENKIARVSYSYTDVLTKNIELQFEDAAE
ncbi:MAG: hypothetical protein LKF01_04175 [Lactobacillus sp.]|jgi:uncharacterized protein Veg|nr:hypothetical protein [Lactobacillus sp.]MCH3905816.1 hypothetical protein [Lactobacillus sp.]MCH3990603.1 hypothetical protein [Lactobacillus sp.]MCH4068681.1 hypothetical protein [Lactobacillus sp.]MCI1303834.1 hypothetical protein [Lactobacillus sp.]